MKKYLRRLTVFLAVLFSSLYLYANAEEITYVWEHFVSQSTGNTIVDYSFEFSFDPSSNTNEATLTKFNNVNLENHQEPKIPSSFEYDGKKYYVTKLGKEAFSYADISTIDIPSTVKIFEPGVFFQSKLAKITIPKTVKLMKDIEWEKGLFQDCVNLSSVIIETGGASRFPHGTFAGCKSLTSIVIPEGVDTLGGEMFSGSELKSIKLPNTLTTLGSYYDKGTFFNCPIDSIEIPNSVMTMPDCFRNCTNLKYVKLSNRVESLFATFDGCTSLETINIPESVKSLVKATFRSCPVQSIYIPYNVSNIEFSLDYDNKERINANCLQLDRIEIDPDNQWFDSRENCNAIIRKNGDIMIVGCNKSTFPSTLKGIQKGCFKYFNIEECIISSNDTYIDPEAFLDCKKLKKVILPSRMAFIAENTFRC